MVQTSETFDRNVHNLFSQLDLLNLCSAAPNQLEVASVSDERQNVPASLVGAKLCLDVSPGRGRGSDLERDPEGRGLDGHGGQDWVHGP